MRLGLLFNGLLKVPMQFFILFIGVMVFVFYQFNYSPINFNPAAEKVIHKSSYSSEYRALETAQKSLFEKKKRLVNSYAKYPSNSIKSEIVKANAKDRELRNQAQQLISMAAKEVDEKIDTNDKDYVFIHFILNNLPKGLIGLLLAVILSAGMSSTASELNALASTTALDLYKRNTSKTLSDLQMVSVTKWFTLAWGILAIIIACVAYLADNLIQLVNIIGSIFYGNVLGIFLLGFFFKHIKANAVFAAAIATQLIIIGLFILDRFELINLPYLWLNFVGCLIVIILAHLVPQRSK